MSNNSRGQIVEVEKPFRLRTLNSLAESLTLRGDGQPYGPIPDPMLRDIRPGSMVQVYAESTKFEKKTPETLWILVDRVRKNSIRGVVNTRSQRGNFHGLKFNDTIEFTPGHVVDIWVNVQRTKVPLGDNIKVI